MIVVCIVFDRFLMGWLLARVHLGRVSCGSAFGPEHLGLMGWQWLEEATPLPRVELLDGPQVVRARAQQSKWHTAADKHKPHCQSRPSPTLFSAGREKLGPCMVEALLRSMESRVFFRVFGDESVVVPRSSSSCTQKHTTSTRSSALWVATLAAQVSGETFLSLNNKKTCTVTTCDNIPNCLRR